MGAHNPYDDMISDIEQLRFVSNMHVKKQKGA